MTRHKVVRVGGVVAALALAVAVSGQFTLAAAQTAAQIAEGFANRMRDAGIRLTEQDVATIRVMERHRAEVLDKYRLLDGFARTFEDTGDGANLQKVDLHKQRLRQIQRSLPTSNATVGGYYLRLRAYLNGAAGKHNEWMVQMDRDLTQFAQVAEAKTEPEAPQAGEQPIGSKVEVEILALQGEIEWYVNGVKVERVGQTIPVEGDLVGLRALGVNGRRASARNPRISENTEYLELDDYRMAYEVTNGGFQGMTDWNVDDEIYDWTVRGSLPYWVNGMSTSSGLNPHVQNDGYLLRFTSSFSAAFLVEGETFWQGVSERPGGVRELESDDFFEGGIQFTVAPR